MGDLVVSPHSPEPFVERCKVALSNVRVYVHGVACTAPRHALAVVKSLYPTVSIEVIDGGFAEEMEDAEVEQITEEATESALKLIEDLDIFGDREQNKNN